jgi:hypothetical protein
MLMKGIRREDGPGADARKLPATRRHLERAQSMLNMRKAKDRAIWAGICLGFFMMLRSRNYSAKSEGDRGGELYY